MHTIISTSSLWYRVLFSHVVLISGSYVYRTCAREGEMGWDVRWDEVGGHSFQNWLGGEEGLAWDEFSLLPHPFLLPYLNPTNRIIKWFDDWQWEMVDQKCTSAASYFAGSGGFKDREATDDLQCAKKSDIVVIKYSQWHLGKIIFVQIFLPSWSERENCSATTRTNQRA